MHKTELIQYWKETSDKDLITMNHLFEAGDYHWSLFIGHLVIEKLLKALFVKLKASEVPRVHDLSRICELCGLELDEELENKLDLITTFNINARYPDYKNSFYKKCTKEFTKKSVNKILEIRTWILSELERK